MRGRALWAVWALVIASSAPEAVQGDKASQARKRAAAEAAIKEQKAQQTAATLMMMQRLENSNQQQQEQQHSATQTDSVAASEDSAAKQPAGKNKASSKLSRHKQQKPVPFNLDSDTVFLKLLLLGVVAIFTMLTMTLTFVCYKYWQPKEEAPARRTYRGLSVYV